MIDGPMIDASHAQTNGVHPGAPGISRAAALMDREPLARVLDLGDRASMTILVALLVASVAHGAAAARAAFMSLELARFAALVQDHVAQRVADTYDIDIIKPPEPPPPPPPEPEPEPAKAAPPPTHVPKDAPPPPPAAAQAGAALTKEPDPNEPVDLTNSIVTGPGTSYAGGTTQVGGTSTTPVYNQAARAGGTPGGTGTAPAGVDRSRVASLIGDPEWKCPFPPEADTADINQAQVLIEVQVAPDGRPQGVTVLKDPGNGFGREAKRCAMQKLYGAPLDVNGKPVAGKTKPIRVTFNR